MTDKETRDPVINGNKYHVVIAQSERRQRVSVYEYSSSFDRYSQDDAIVTNKEWKGSLLWFGPDSSLPIEELVQETLNEAVCIRENKIEDQEEYEDRLEQAINIVEETHDN